MIAHEVRYFSWNYGCKKTFFLTLLLLGFIFDYIFDPKKDDFFCPVFVSGRGMSNVTCDLMVYLKSKGFNIS